MMKIFQGRFKNQNSAREMTEDGDTYFNEISCSRQHYTFKFHASCWHQNTCCGHCGQLCDTGTHVQHDITTKP